MHADLKTCSNYCLSLELMLSDSKIESASLVCATQQNVYVITSQSHPLANIKDWTASAAVLFLTFVLFMVLLNINTLYNIMCRIVLANIFELPEFCVKTGDDRVYISQDQYK